MRQYPEAARRVVTSAVQAARVGAMFPTRTQQPEREVERLLDQSRRPGSPDQPDELGNAVRRGRPRSAMRSPIIDITRRRRDHYVELADAAATRQDRYSRSEVKFISTVDVASTRALADAAAKRHRDSTHRTDSSTGASNFS